MTCTGRPDVFDDIVLDTDMKTALSRLADARRGNRLDKGSIASRKTIRLEDLDGLSETGEYELVIDGMRYRFFFNAARSERMYVFLNGYGADERYSRWSWNPYGYTLAFIDPMYLEYGLKLGWYFGNCTVDCRKVIADIVSRIASSHGLSSKDIVTFGNSGGGTAALYISSYLPGSTSVALNPQVDIRVWKNSSKELEKIVGPLDPGNCPRNDYPTVLRKLEGRHIIGFNCASDKDYGQVEKLASELGMSLKYGISKGLSDRFMVWSFQTECTISEKGDWSYHHTTDTLQLFPFFDHLIDSWDDPGLQKEVLFLNEVLYERSLQLHKAQALQSLLDYEKDPLSRFRVAVMYEKGDCVEKDLYRSYTILKEESDRKNKRAIAYLPKFLKKHPGYKGQDERE